MSYTTLGNDILDTSDYEIVATAKTDEIAESIASALNAAQQSAQADECPRCHSLESQHDPQFDWKTCLKCGTRR